MNQAFGENTVTDRKKQGWFENFRSGDFSLQNEYRGKYKTSVKNDALKAWVPNSSRAIEFWAFHPISGTTSVVQFTGYIFDIPFLPQWSSQFICSIDQSCW
ncbi:hypothetical protein TNCV_4367521 [Trichonephila clavipes]|nr:hypothetical protein TNCV_4367521 [Trichonephila clavipes]